MRKTQIDDISSPLLASPKRKSGGEKVLLFLLFVAVISIAAFFKRQQFNDLEIPQGQGELLEAFEMEIFPKLLGEVLPKTDLTTDFLSRWNELLVKVVPEASVRDLHVTGARRCEGFGAYADYSIFDPKQTPKIPDSLKALIKPSSKIDMPSKLNSPSPGGAKSDNGDMSICKLKESVIRKYQNRNMETATSATGKGSKQEPGKTSVNAGDFKEPEVKAQEPGIVAAPNVAPGILSSPKENKQEPGAGALLQGSPASFHIDIQDLPKLLKSQTTDSTIMKQLSLGNRFFEMHIGNFAGVQKPGGVGTGSSLIFSGNYAEDMMGEIKEFLKKFTNEIIHLSLVPSAMSFDMDPLQRRTYRRMIAEIHDKLALSSSGLHKIKDIRAKDWSYLLMNKQNWYDNLDFGSVKFALLSEPVDDCGATYPKIDESGIFEGYETAPNCNHEGICMKISKDAGCTITASCKPDRFEGAGKPIKSCDLQYNANCKAAANAPKHICFKSFENLIEFDMGQENIPDPSLKANQDYVKLCAAPQDYSWGIYQMRKTLDPEKLKQGAVEAEKSSEIARYPLRSSIPSVSDKSGQSIQNGRRLLKKERPKTGPLLKLSRDPPKPNPLLDLLSTTEEAEDISDKDKLILPTEDPATYSDSTAKPPTDRSGSPPRTPGTLPNPSDSFPPLSPLPPNSLHNNHGHDSSGGHDHHHIHFHVHWDEIIRENLEFKPWKELYHLGKELSEYIPFFHNKNWFENLLNFFTFRCGGWHGAETAVQANGEDDMKVLDVKMRNGIPETDYKVFESQNIKDLMRFLLTDPNAPQGGIFPIDFLSNKINIIQALIAKNFKVSPDNFEKHFDILFPVAPTPAQDEKPKAFVP